MRLYLKINPNSYTIPFNYQNYLTGALHKWIGNNNDIHGKICLHNFSWLQNVKVVTNKGIKTGIDSYFFISAFDQALIQKILLGIIKDPTLFADIRVTDAQIVEEPAFSKKETFLAASPITEPKVYPKMYNAAYVINVRVKNTVAYFTGTYTAPWDDPFTKSVNKMDPLFKDEPILNYCNKKGKPFQKSLARYPFMLMSSSVNCFNTPIEYAKL